MSMSISVPPGDQRPAAGASHQPDIQAGRLSPSEYAVRFADATPRLSASQAVLEAERCLYCFDAPCATACPTSIDVPSFIRRIADGNVRGSARTILESNPLGGMCARVCPTENLCEAVCVRHTQEDRPVAIGRLQRFAVDALMESAQPQLFTRAAATGKKVAVVGAGPAGLACAHTLARQGHEVTVFDARPKAGGLNEYGLASYKTPDNYAQRSGCWTLAASRCAITGSWRLPRNCTRCARTLTRCSWAWGWHPRTSWGCPAKHWRACRTRWISLPRCGRRPICPPCPWGGA